MIVREVYDDAREVLRGGEDSGEKQEGEGGFHDRRKSGEAGICLRIGRDVKLN